jgi:hypothetical protein
VLELKRSIIWLAFLALVAGLVLEAEGTGERSPRDVIEAYRIWKLTDALDLPEEEMPVFFSRLRRIEVRRQEFDKAEQEVIEDIGHMLGKEKVDEGELKRALERYDGIRLERFKELEKLRQDAVSILTLRQTCEYIAFEDRFKREMRQMIGRVKEMRRLRGESERGRY